MGAEELDRIDLGINFLRRGVVAGSEAQMIAVLSSSVVRICTFV
jgi:hypothetical protein